MISYELARSLKDAGFPQAGKGVMFRPYIFSKNIYLPTLEELIAACGDYLSMLQHDMTGWIAYGGTDKNKLTTTGPTLDEAVALLWIRLKLNPKTI